MENISIMKQENQFNKMNHNNRLWLGILLVITGAVLLAVKMGADIPRWLYSWEAFLIGIGLVIGLRHNFRNPAPFIMIFIGAAFLADEYFTDFNFHAYIWPGAIIVAGLYFILRPKNPVKTTKEWMMSNSNETPQTGWQSGFQPVHDNAGVSSEEVVDVTAAFGSVEKRIISKTFRGGDITAFMGGVEIDLTGADIADTAVLDVSAVFGGVKLVIPADWRVQNKAVAVFGGVEDKRVMPATFSNKLLVIDGAAVFGGIELKSY